MTYHEQLKLDTLKRIADALERIADHLAPEESLPCLYKSNEKCAHPDCDCIDCELYAAIKHNQTINETLDAMNQQN